MAGLLADIFSAGDTAKRKLRGLLGDPVGTVTQFVNNENDRAGRLKELTYEAAMERRQRVKGGDLFGMGPKETQLTGLLADAYNPAGIIGPQHADVLRSMSKGLGDDVLDAAFGSSGYVYHTPLRPFEPSQQTAIGVKARPIAQRVFETETPLSAMQLRSIEAVPASENASMAFAKELSDEGAFAFMNKDRKRFSVVLPSTKQSGAFQATQYDPRGAIGDSQHTSQAEAIQRLIDAGYSDILDESRAGKMLQRVMVGQ